MSSDNPIGVPFIELQQVGSTNNYAIGLVHEGMAQHGMAVFAHHQIRGKGQRHKSWYGEAKKNIAVSVILKPDTLLSQSFGLSMAIAVGVQRFLASRVEGIKIKWPNDIYWNDRKAAGILIENTVQGAVCKWSVAGIGININQTVFDNVAHKAVSLKQITGKEYEPVAMAKELCRYLQAAYQELNHSRETLIASYKEALYKLNEAVVLKKDARIFNAIIRDVTLTGELVAQTALEEMFSVGEVEWVL